MQKMKVTSSPHIFNVDNTTGIMLDVIIALLPATICGICFFGFNALLTVMVAIASAVASEYLWCKAIKKQTSIRDLSAVVTGLLLGLNLPSTLPLWMTALGSAIAIVVVKQMFGGLGYNFANPAITARIALMVSFPTAMTTYIVPFTNNVVSSATPLAGGEVELSKFWYSPRCNRRNFCNYVTCRWSLFGNSQGNNPRNTFGIYGVCRSPCICTWR